MRPIDADELWRNLTRLPGGYVTSFAGQACLAQIEDAPTLDYAPVRHGEWIEYVSVDPDYLTREIEYKCSECGMFALNKYSYCHCGAKMDGGGKTDGCL